jgi:hypothetical protein
MTIRTKPDFTGSWRWNPRRSALQIPHPDSTHFVVVHHEPSLRLTRTHCFAGECDTLTVELTTDGRESEIYREGAMVRMRVTWDGEALLFESGIDLPGGEARNVVRYKLEESGHCVIAEERYRSATAQYDNTWVFERE